MADESKPAVTSAEPAVVADAAPAAAAEPKAEETPAAEATATEAKAEEPAAPAAEASAAADEAAPAEAEAVKEAEPIYAGTLQYANHPIKALLQLKPKMHFYFGSDTIKAEAEKLKHIVKPNEPHTAQTVAWSHETGTGLLYFVKDAEQKDSPQGALNLSGAEELAAAGNNRFSFRLHGSKHTFTADTRAARDGWFKAFEENIAKAKELKETIVSSPAYQETYEKLIKPALAVPAESAPKKSTDSKSERAARSETQGKNRPAKDRSQSRGKKFFDQLRGKKEAAKEEVATAGAATSDEAPKVEEPAAAEPSGEAAEATEAAAPATEEPATAAAEEAKADEPKKTRRTSKFFDYVKTLSPTREKKQEELAVPEPETEAAPAAEAAAEPSAEGTEAATNGEAAATEAAAAETPAAEGTEAAATEAAAPGEKTERRRSSFFGTIRNTLQKSGAKAEGAKEEAKPDEAAAEKPADAAAETPADAPADSPVEKKANNVASRVGELRRNLSKALRVGNKNDKKKAPGTEKVEESATEAKPEEEAKAEEPKPAAEPAAEEPKTEAVAAPTGPTVIGDVVGEAVTVGTAPPTNPTVSATA